MSTLVLSPEIGHAEPGALRPVIWTRAFEAKYDSAWWLCMCFCAVNKIPRAAFDRDYLGGNIDHYSGRGALRAAGFLPLLLEEEEPVALHLARTDPVYESASRWRAMHGSRFYELPFRRTLMTRTLGFYAGSSTEALATGDHTRFCPECLKVGYHSIFHQLAALVCCPIHRCPFIDRCPGCRSPTVPFHFGGKGHLKGFTCGCGYRFGDGEWPSLTKPAGFLAQEAEAMAPLAAWSRSLADLRLDFRGLIRNYRNQGDSPLRAKARLFTFLHSMQPFQGDLDLFDYSPPQPSHYCTFAPIEDEAEDTNALRHYVKLHKAIRRHIERRILRRDASRIYKEKLGGMLINFQSRSIVPDPFACLYSQAYALWRLRTEVFALQAVNLAPAPMRTIPRLKEIITSLAPVNSTMVAYGLLAHYYRCVDTILDAVEVAMPWSKEGISQFQLDTAFVDNHWRQGLSFAPEDIIEALDYATVKMNGMERSLIFMPDPNALGERIAAYGLKVRKLADQHAAKGPMRRKRRFATNVNRQTTEAQDLITYQRFVLDPLGGSVVKPGTLREVRAGA